MADLSRVVHFTNVRLSYPNIIAPQVTKDAKTGKERVSYGASLIFLPNDPNFARFMQVVTEVAIAKWKEQANLVLTHVQRDTKGRCYVMGEEKVNSTTMKPNPENIGHVIISAYNRNMPQMVDASGAPVDPANTMACQAIARKMYAGCRVNVALKPWPQDNTQGKGIRCELVALQFAGDDTPFGERHVDVTGMFGATEAAPAATGFAASPWVNPSFLTPSSQHAQSQQPQSSFGNPGVPSWGAPATNVPTFLR